MRCGIKEGPLAGRRQGPENLLRPLLSRTGFRPGSNPSSGPRAPCLSVLLPFRSPRLVVPVGGHGVLLAPFPELLSKLSRFSEDLLRPLRRVLILASHRCASRTANQQTACPSRAGRRPARPVRSGLSRIEPWQGRGDPYRSRQGSNRSWQDADRGWRRNDCGRRPANHGRQRSYRGWRRPYRGWQPANHGWQRDDRGWRGSNRGRQRSYHGRQRSYLF